MEKFRFKMCSSRAWKFLRAWARKKKGLSIEDTISLNLNWNSNVHGDFIIMMNCRSIWTDEFGFYYHCDNLYREGLYQNHKGISI